MADRGFTKAGLERLHEVMQRHVDDGSHPGLVWMVARPGNVHTEAIGVDTYVDPRQDGSRPMGVDTIFRIASMTKPVTATATMQLVEDCRIRLDDPVDEWLPELANRQVLRTLESEIDDTVPAERPITVRDLLTFRAGYGMITAEPGSLPILRHLDEIGMDVGPPQPAAEPDVDGWIARFRDLPLAHQPGERWMYHTGSDLLGVLIARVSGQSFSAFLRERIFEPLDMADTGFFVPAADIDRLPPAYSTNPATGSVEILDPAVRGQWSAPPKFASGGAGLVSTIDDFHRFSVMLASNGIFRGERILSRASVALMTTDHLTAEQKATAGLAPGFWDSHGWGFGMSVVTKRVDVSTAPGQFGWDGGLGTAWSADTTETLITLLMTQQAWTSPTPPAVVSDFRTAAYAALDD